MPTVRIALSASMAVAIWLLALTEPASAEAGEAVEAETAVAAAVTGASAAAATEAPVPAAEAVVEQAPPASVSPAPTQAPEPTEAQGASAPGAGGPVDAAAKSVSVSSPSLPGRTAAPSAPSTPPGPGAAIGGSRLDEAAAAAAPIKREASNLVKSFRKGSAAAVAPVTDRLEGGSLLSQASESLLEVTELSQWTLDRARPAAVEALLSPLGSSPQPTWSSSNEPTWSSSQGPDGFSVPPLASVGGSLLQRPGGFGGASAGPAATASAAPERPERSANLLSVVDDAGDTLAFAPIDRSGTPRPARGPLPAPNLPGAPAASGSGGTSFVPLAALLALLALVAPAVLRRLGEVPDFRPPTPFVCALERPG